MAEAAATAAVVTGATLFEYNRKNFLYDRDQRLETELQIMDFQLKKQDMFREDIEDIIELTSVKMESYMIVNVFQINMCIVAICEGRMQPGAPDWLIAAHTLSFVCAFTFLVISVWFSMHATVSSKAYEVKLRTQLVRLPIPSWSQLEGARTYGSAFEKTEARQMFRVPFLCGTQEQVASGGCFPPLGGAKKGSGSANAQASTSETTPQKIGFGDMLASNAQCEEAQERVSADPWGLEKPGEKIYELDASLQTDPRKLQHIQMVREALQYWQGSDAFARVSMSVGTSQFCVGFAYYVLGYVLVYDRAIVGALLAVVLFLSVSFALIRIDMSLTTEEYIIATVLQLAGPVLMALCTTFWATDVAGLAIVILMPVIYVLHVAWLLYLASLLKVTEQQNGAMMPTGFRAVLYIDVFGWIKRNVAGERVFLPRSSKKKTDDLQSDAVVPVAGAGPAVKIVQYEGGRAVPMRPEELPGAPRRPGPADITREDFAPHTFVPRLAEHGRFEGQVDYDADIPAGARPWHTFYFVIVAFAFIWFLSGVMMTLLLCGLMPISAEPQIRDLRALPHKVQKPVEMQSLSQLAGQPIDTAWPHDNVHPYGLACNGARRTMVASSRFGIYSADLSSSTLENGIEFKKAPVCEETEGNALLDISLQCGPEASKNSCQAIVLHQKGNLLAACALEANATARPWASSSVRGAWLGGYDSASKTPKENVQAFALPQEKGGSHRKAYMATSSERLVEMREAVNDAGVQAMYPKRLLASVSAAQSGTIDVIGDQYLALLQSGGRRIEVRDLKSGGAVVGVWRLPSVPGQRSLAPEASGWTAMCATGENLFVMSRGPSPSIWQFSLPPRLMQHSDDNVANRQS